MTPSERKQARDLFLKLRQNMTWEDYVSAMASASPHDDETELALICMREGFGRRAGKHTMNHVKRYLQAKAEAIVLENRTNAQERTST